MRRTPPLAAAALVAATLTTACDRADSPAGPELDEVPVAEATLPTVTPGPLVTVAGPGSSLELWPYTGRDMTGTPVDPINLVFPDIDPLSVRAALLMADGNRPPGLPFDCTWKEAMGANQTSYATGAGWNGSAIQLECGDYGPVRFHVRLFQQGSWTLGAAHFEVQIMGTNEHEVLSWEIAEALVTSDLASAGVLGGAPFPTAPITPAPSYRTINPLVYNGLPAGLKLIAGGPETATEPVPIGNDGRATVIPFAGPVEGERMLAKRSFVLEFDQMIPKPFCMDGPADWLQVEGPIDFTQKVLVTNGVYQSQFRAKGWLELTPVNPITGDPVGETVRARVVDSHKTVMTDAVTLVTSMRLQFILPSATGAGERLYATLNVGPGAASGATLDITCDD